MKIPKHHKEYKTRVYLDFYECSELEAKNQIESAFMLARTDGVIEPRLSLEWEGGWADIDARVWYIKGCVPMTEKEVAQSEARSKIAKATAARKKAEKEAEEKAEFIRLAKKFGVEVNDG